MVKEYDIDFCSCREVMNQIDGLMQGWKNINQWLPVGLWEPSGVTSVLLKTIDNFCWLEMKPLYAWLMRYTSSDNLSSFIKLCHLCDWLVSLQTAPPGVFPGLLALQDWMLNEPRCSDCMLMAGQLALLSQGMTAVVYQHFNCQTCTNSRLEFCTLELRQCKIQFSQIHILVLTLFNDKQNNVYIDIIQPTRGPFY